MRHIIHEITAILFAALLLFPELPLAAQSPIVIDASAPATAPGPANYTFAPEDARSPDGHVLGVNTGYFTLDGKPWLPVMGEIHYSRVPAAEWEEEILKMKSAGVQVIAAYVIWIHHEEIEGEWNWSDNRDIRRFVQLCAKHGLYVVPRIGPWSHAEVRNGGFPDWLLARTNHNERSNDPAYLSAVEALYKQIGRQLHGLLWSQGGPVVAIQLENEYSRRGAGRGTDHILRLKQMALDAGLRVPFYTVTGWDGAAIPHGAVLPVYGGYPDAPWDASIQKLKPNEVYAFRFGSRVTGDMGAIGAGQPPAGNAANFTTDTPFITAEMGGGMQVTYHRRPVVSPDDVAAMVPVMLGSGVNLYGVYMFHGGENPDGRLSTLQESLATHYANDLPTKTYDFEAPIGEFGDERPSLLKLKSWNYFMNDFGADLAPMQPHAPDRLPANPDDFAVPRLSVRTSGSRGFLFVNHHVRGEVMPARHGFQAEVKLPGGSSIQIPAKPIDVPVDAYFVWPFNMDLNGVHLRYATAQPFAKLGTAAAPVYAFFAQPGIKPEFVVENTPGLKFEISPESTGGVERTDGAIRFPGLQLKDRGDTIVFRLPGGRRVTILLLPQKVAEQSWRVHVGATTALISTPQDAFVDGDSITLTNLGGKDFSANILPAEALRLVSSDSAVKLTHTGTDVTATVSEPGAPVQPLSPDQTRPAGDPAPLPDGFKPSSRPRVVAAAPTDADWSRAALWQIQLPAAPAQPTTRQFLRIRYTGDVARLSAGGKLLTDNFFDGRPWLVGLTRFASQTTGKPLELAIYPLRKAPPIFFEPGLAPDPGATADKLESVELVTQFRLRLRVEPPNKPAH